MPRAAIGRIVHVFTDPGQNNGIDIAPAIITRVWSYTEGRTEEDGPIDPSVSLVNVRVLLDGPDTPWKTSIEIHETRELAQAAHSASWSGVSVDQPVTPYAAFWPPHA